MLLAEMERVMGVMSYRTGSTETLDGPVEQKVLRQHKVDVPVDKYPRVRYYYSYLWYFIRYLSNISDQ